MIFGKKNKDEIKEVFYFNYTDLTAIEEYLTLKEKEGLRLKEIDGEKMILTKAEPRENIRYCAEIYVGSSGDDFLYSCKQEGWTHCGTYRGELYIFRTNQINATDIMTDEELKMKIIRKRVLLRPGNISYFMLIILKFLQFIMDLDMGLNESRIEYWLWWIIIGVFAYRPVCILSDYLIWLVKAKGALRRGEKVKYLSHKGVKIRNFVYSIVLLILSLGALAFVCIADAGYSTSYALTYWFVISLSVLAFFSLLSNFKTKTAYGKAVKILTLILVIEALIFGTYMSAKVSRQHFESTEKIYNTINIPFSLSDLGYDEKDCTDKCMSHNITRFAQHYFYSSDYEAEGAENAPPEEYEEKNEYVFYEVFVSDYPHIREKYINSKLKKYKKYGYEIKAVDSSQTSWDVCYRETDEDGEERWAGFAVKGNTIFFTDILVDTKGEDLFEVAYEKLFES